MDQKTHNALATGGIVDITTTGRRSGQQRRIEIALHSIDGHLYISGRPSPNKRAWIANLEADPHMTLHLKNGARADLPAIGRVIDDEAERRQVLPSIARVWSMNVDSMVAASPLIEVTIEDR